MRSVFPEKELGHDEDEPTYSYADGQHLRARRRLRSLKQLCVSSNIHSHVCHSYVPRISSLDVSAWFHRPHNTALSPAPFDASSCDARRTASSGLRGPSCTSANKHPCHLRSENRRPCRSASSQPACMIWREKLLNNILRKEPGGTETEVPAAVKSSWSLFISTTWP